MLPRLFLFLLSGFYVFYIVKVSSLFLFFSILPVQCSHIIYTVVYFLDLCRRVLIQSSTLSIEKGEILCFDSRTTNKNLLETTKEYEFF